MTSRYLIGLGSLQELKQILDSNGSKRVFLISGKGSFFDCGAAAVVESLSEDREIFRFYDFDTNPKFVDALRGRDLARAFNADLVLAIGGGSVIDMAKLVLAFLSAPGREKELVEGKCILERQALPFVVAPTTAGTGSEATHFAVVYIDGKKFSLASNYLIPSDTLLDGSLARAATPYQLACSGLDALAQAIESAWAVGSTSESRRLAFDATEVLFQLLPIAVAGNADDDIFQRLMSASNLAGRAINISKTTAAHAWSYAITTHYDIPHGHAVWLTLPKIMDIHLIAAQSTEGLSEGCRADQFKETMMILSSSLGVSPGSLASNSLQDFMTLLNVEPMMEALGANTKEQRSFLSKQVNAQRMSNNPVKFTREHASSIFRI